MRHGICHQERMSSIKALVPYQTETFRPHLARSGASPQHSGQEQAPRREAPRAAVQPRRSTPFLAQLIVNTEADLRKSLGRQDIAQARQSAYQAALDKRPSASPLQFLHVIGKA